MSRLKLRDRIYNRKVGNAMTGPLGIVCAGGGVAAGLVLGLPIIAAFGLGAVAWAVRVAVAMPRGIDLDGTDPFVLAEPWRSYVWKAKKSRRAFFDAIGQTRQGPLKDRLESIADRIETGVAECWSIAQSGQALAQARSQIDTASVQAELSQINWNPTGVAPTPGSSRAETVSALESQLATAARLDKVIGDTDDKLRLLDARLSEAVTRAIELSARGQQVDEIASLVTDVDSVVSDMESLRLALDETDRVTGASMPAAPATQPGTAPPTEPVAQGSPGLASPGPAGLPEGQLSNIPQMPATRAEETAARAEPPPRAQATWDAEPAPGSEPAPVTDPQAEAQPNSRAQPPSPRQRPA